MGTFSSGSEGLDYQATYCERCVHFKGYSDPDGCPVWQLHELFNGLQHEDGDVLIPLSAVLPEDGDRWHGPTAKLFLDSLIPLSQEIWNRECVMFHVRHDGDPCPTCDSEHDKCNDPRHPCGCGAPVWKHAGGRCPRARGRKCLSRPSSRICRRRIVTTSFQPG